MLEGVEGEVRSRRPGVESPFLLPLVILRFCLSITGRRNISAGAANVYVWEVHICRMASMNEVLETTESKHARDRDVNITVF